MANTDGYLELFGSMIENIKTRVTLNAVVLFGSRARGDAHEYSDYDILVIGSFTESIRKRRDWILNLAPFVSIDLFCFTPAEFTALFNDFNLTAIDAIGDGIVLFGEEFVVPFKIMHQDFVERGMKKTSCLLVHPQ